MSAPFRTALNPLRSTGPSNAAPRLAGRRPSFSSSPRMPSSPTVLPSASFASSAAPAQPLIASSGGQQKQQQQQQHGSNAAASTLATHPTLAHIFVPQPASPATVTWIGTRPASVPDASQWHVPSSLGGGILFDGPAKRSPPRVLHLGTEA